MDSAKESGSSSSFFPHPLFLNWLLPIHGGIATAITHSHDIVTVIIFDFDGTIADSFETVLNISNRLAHEYGYPPTLQKDIKRLKNLSSREILNQSKVPIWRLPFLLRRLRVELNREIQYLKPIPGIQEALYCLNQHGHRLGIVTSNSKENVIAFLKAHDLEDLFDFVDSGLTLFGKGRVIRRLIRRKHLDPSIVVYVGDETRDIEAAKKINIKGIAVGWGFNSSEALAQTQPDALIFQPGELAAVIEGLGHLPG